MDSAKPSPATRIDNQLNSLGDELDRADSDAIHAVFKALQPLTSPRVIKVKRRALREAVQKIWQEPRMPKGESRFAHNKPLDYPWSPNARDLYFAHRADPSVIIKNRLDLEHVTPIGLLTDELEALFTNDECSPDAFFDRLKEVHVPLSFAVLTREDHTALGRVKMKAATVTGEGVSIWARYAAIGLKEEDFMAITADPRFAADLVSQN
ncbi:MAG TPA: hypothetical protein VF885_06910 [Arthrobacter sp.]